MSTYQAGAELFEGGPYYQFPDNCLPPGPFFTVYTVSALGFAGLVAMCICVRYIGSVCQRAAREGISVALQLLEDMGDCCAGAGSGVCGICWCLRRCCIVCTRLRHCNPCARGGWVFLDE